MFAQRTNWNLTPNLLSQALAVHRAAGKPLLDLTISNPTECGFTYDGPGILEALSNPTALAYEPNAKGLESARRAVAAYYAAREDDVSPEDIFLTTSTSEAYSYVFRTLCNPGDEVLVPSPSYPLFDFLAEIQDVKLVRYPLLYDHGWQIDFHVLEQAITSRTRGVIVVHPNNPTGHFAKREAVARLEVIADTYLSVNAPVQLAMPKFLEQRHAFQEQVISRVRRNLAELDRQLATQKVSSRLAVEGGWCTVLRVPATRSDEDLAVELLTTKGVYVHPGHFYDFGSDGHLVLSLITPESQFSSGVMCIAAMDS